MKKTCPIMRGEGPAILCKEGNCAWYDQDAGRRFVWRFLELLGALTVGFQGDQRP